MSRFKFRVWDGVNMFLSPDSIEHLGSWFDTHAPGGLYQGGVEFMQWTGLQDKNGKDIYEGDVLEIRTQSGRVERFLVKYGIHRRDMKSGWTVDIPSFAFVSEEGFATFPIVQNYCNGHDLELIAVIGNVYENPELLNT